MRAAAILGLGTSPADLLPFQSGSPTSWIHGLPASSGAADAIVIFGGDGTIHRHLSALAPPGAPEAVERGVGRRAVEPRRRVLGAGRVKSVEVDEDLLCDVLGFLRVGQNPIGDPDDAPVLRREKGFERALVRRHASRPGGPKAQHRQFCAHYQLSTADPGFVTALRPAWPSARDDLPQR